MRYLYYLGVLVYLMQQMRAKEQVMLGQFSDKHFTCSTLRRPSLLLSHAQCASINLCERKTLDHMFHDISVTSSRCNTPRLFLYHLNQPSLPHIRTRLDHEHFNKCFFLIFVSAAIQMLIYHLEDAPKLYLIYLLLAFLDAVATHVRFYLQEGTHLSSPVIW